MRPDSFPAFSLIKTEMKTAARQKTGCRNGIVRKKKSFRRPHGKKRRGLFLPVSGGHLAPIPVRYDRAPVCRKPSVRRARRAIVPLPAGKRHVNRGTGPAGTKGRHMPGHKAVPASGWRTPVPAEPSPDKTRPPEGKNGIKNFPYENGCRFTSITSPPCGLFSLLTD